MFSTAIVYIFNASKCVIVCKCVNAPAKHSRGLTWAWNFAIGHFFPHVRLPVCLMLQAVLDKLSFMDPVSYDGLLPIVHHKGGLSPLFSEHSSYT